MFLVNKKKCLYTKCPYLVPPVYGLSLEMFFFFIVLAMID